MFFLDACCAIVRQASFLHLGAAMPTIREMLAVAELRQAFGELRPGFLEHESFEGPHRGVGVGVDRVAAIPVEPGALVRVVELSEHTDSDGSRGLLRS